MIVARAGLKRGKDTRMAECFAFMNGMGGMMGVVMAVMMIGGALLTIALFALIIVVIMRLLSTNRWSNGDRAA
jgi:predicted lipid-binding transport protein (Tim44 family)